MIAYDSSNVKELDIFFFRDNVFFWPDNGSYTNYMLLNTSKPEAQFKPVGPTILVEWEE